MAMEDTHALAAAVVTGGQIQLNLKDKILTANVFICYYSLRP